MIPGKINLREMGCEQMGSGQIGHAEINVLRNDFCFQYLKSHSDILSQSKYAAITR